LKRPDGTITEDAHELGRLTTYFYKEMYRLEGVSDMDQVLNSVPATVTAEMNDALIAPFEKM
jgi:hypothetical protein